MKKTLLILSTILVAFSGLSQEPIRTRKVVQVMPQQEMYLNGGIRSAFGGKSRVYYQITLPPNTVEWYYVVTTHPAEQHPSLNLLPQLTKLLDPTGTTAILASAIMTPTGSNTCDVYLMDRANADAFIQKADNNGGKYFHVVSANRENFRNGTVQINNIKQGTWYLGFKNPSESQGIGISFEVAAIVEEVGYAVEQTKAINYGNLG
ncbi:MAG TPA: hypothetical protein VD996_10965, partial [Chitinophagaceae bacterium]|nr:hypothetical protein [Chitinophagaceae bacterium]